MIEHETLTESCGWIGSTMPDGRSENLFLYRLIMIPVRHRRDPVAPEAPPGHDPCIVLMYY
jgi:hypothetical protein